MSPYRLASSPLRAAALPLLALALSLAAVVSWKYGFITPLRRHATVVLEHVEVCLAVFLPMARPVASPAPQVAPGPLMQVPETIRQALQRTGAVDGATAAGSAAALAAAAAVAEPEAATATPVAAAAVKLEVAAATATPEHIEKRCRGTAGTWCRDYLMQTPIPAKPPPVANRTCLWGCNFVGELCEMLSMKLPNTS